MRAYKVDTGEIAVVIDKHEVEEILDPESNVPIDSKTTRSMMGWIRAALETK